VTTERTITQLGVENSSAKILPPFTTIITARGTVGQLGLLSREMAMNQTNYGIRGTGNLGEFTTYLLIQHAIERLRQHAYGTVFDTITRKTFDAIPVSRPPNDIWKNFENTIRSWFLKMLANQRENIKLARTRDYLLPTLLSGEVPVEAAEEMVGASAPNEFAA
jgi:type I restriction enzyme S subunit